jgi:hypothetical protein
MIFNDKDVHASNGGFRTLFSETDFGNAVDASAVLFYRALRRRTATRFPNASASGDTERGTEDERGKIDPETAELARNNRRSE